MNTHQKGNAMKRSGFTMIELLVVLAIITVLLSISFVVYGSAVEGARVSATRTTIATIQLAIDARTSALALYNAKSLAQSFAASYRLGANPAPNQTIPENIAEIVVRKNRYKQALPSRLEDLWGYDARPGTPDDSPLWRIWKSTVVGITVTDANPRPTGHRRDLENSELLYLALTKGNAYGDIRLRIDDINARHIRDANDNGIPEFVDDWGNPLRFYNWTHRLVRPGGGTTPIDQRLFSQTAHLLLTAHSPPASPSPYPANIYNHPLNQDADDFTGALSAAQAATGLMTAPFRIDHDLVPGGAVTCPPFNEVHYHTLDTRGISLVISAGPDGNLGLVEPTEAAAPERRTAEPLAYTDPSQLDAVFDNITTRH
jgi:prepilin-type N-terminal cleavage/methylation domain-containing protein